MNTDNETKQNGFLPYESPALTELMLGTETLNIVQGDSPVLDHSDADGDGAEEETQPG